MLHSLYSMIDSLISATQTAIFTDIVQPVLYGAGLMDYDEDAYDGLYWVIAGLLQIVAMYAVLRPLEAWRPVERWTDRKAVRADVIYTWVTKLGLINIAFVVALRPVFDQLQEWLRLRGIANLDLDRLWPGVSSRPLVAFFIYLIILDLAGYWYHRWQHRFGIWWELHAVHHSQVQMSLWTDDRNHLLDDVLQGCFFAALALAIGAQPAQFVLLVTVGNLLQSIQHTNARLPFGPVLDKLVVSPTFHRRHHAVGYGHEGTAYGCNFGVLFPWWDVIFRTASWRRDLEPTGIRDQYPRAGVAGRDYGSGFWAQQLLALVRIAERLGKRRRRALGGGAANA